MAKGLTIAGLVVSGVVGVAFTSDLALGLPFGKVSRLMDLTFLISAGILAYLSWVTMKEQG